MTPPRGMVHLVGAGPGDPGLITVRGLEALRRADVVVHDRLAAAELLKEARPDAVIINAGKAPGDHKLSQDEIAALVIEHARSGRRVVRLKGGDPFVFGRGFEEWNACRAAGIDCEVVPGVTSAVAAPAAAGIPVTLRGVSRGFAVVTAREGEGAAESLLDYVALARIDTLVILMGRENLAEVSRRLIAAGKSAETPAGCVQEATTARQRVVVGTLADIAARADAAALRPPVVTVIGEVVRFGRSEEFAAAAQGIEADGAGALAGTSVVVTGSTRMNRRLRRLLEARGAEVIECRLLNIQWNPLPDPPRRVNFRGSDLSSDDGTFVRGVAGHDWIVFSSVPGVIGYARAMRDENPLPDPHRRVNFRGSEKPGRNAVLPSRVSQQAGSLNAPGAKIASIGPATSRALARAGLKVDLESPEQSAAGLVRALAPLVKGRRVLIPCGDLSRSELHVGLQRAGAIVEELIVYRNEPAEPSNAVCARLREPFDAVVFCSPSAVRRFVSLGIGAAWRGGALVACIGPTTAAAARAEGLNPRVVADQHSADALVNALKEHMSALPSGEHA